MRNHKTKSLSSASYSIHFDHEKKARGKHRIALTGLAIMVVAFSSTVAGPAQAEARNSVPAPFPAGADATIAAPPPSPYVQAESPAEAVQKLNALEKGGATATAARVKYGPCWLYPTPTYLRTSSNKRNVGAKPHTKCTVPVTSIRQASDLRYKSFIWWKKAGKTHHGHNSGEKSYTQRNVEYRCVSREKSGWSGTTAGTIVYHGKTYYARVYFPRRPLNCGG